MADIDYFKKINDTHGGLVSGTTLQEINAVPAANVRPYDVRWAQTSLMIRARRLRHCIADQPIETSVGPTAVTPSLGLASAEQNRKEPLNCEMSLRLADEALYAAKNSRPEPGGIVCGITCGGPVIQSIRVTRLLSEANRIRYTFCI